MMVRSDVWLSLEQLEFRADVLQAAAFHVRTAADTADSLEKRGVTAAACWCAVSVIRKTAEEFRKAVQLASRTGGAPVSQDAVDMFKSFHAVPLIRKEALISKADRTAFKERRAAEDVARAEAVAQKASKAKQRRKA